MKFLKVILCLYCLLIGSVAILNLVADGRDQPLRDVVTIICMGVTILGVFTNQKQLLFSIPVYMIFITAVAATKTSNIYYALGQTSGSIIPLLLVYFTYKKMNPLNLPKS